MMKKASEYLIIVMIVNFIATGCKQVSPDNPELNLLTQSYYVSPDGDDLNPGTPNKPWKSIDKINSVDFKPGDSIMLKGGFTYSGTIHLSSSDSGTKNNKLFIGSYGTARAIILGENVEGIILDHCTHLAVKNLTVIGAGRNEGNTRNGVIVKHSSFIEIENLEISGFQKSGLLLRNCSNTTIHQITAHENGYAGISVDGEQLLKTENRNIKILHCHAENNPGDPTNFTNHSGNGIIVGQCTKVKIAYCTATNNGWDMPRTGNGPVGIWAWESDSVIIENCLSYRNKTSVGGGDGGGFDLDGGVTNSVIQYCLSYENQGSGIGLFQYDMATPWENNIIRFNISINDGNVSGAKSGLCIWSASPTNKLRKALIYNNTIYNSENAAIGFASITFTEDFAFYNNILVGKKEIISGNTIRGAYLGNCWWSFNYGFNVNLITDFDQWRVAKQQEMLNGSPVGINLNPDFIITGSLDIKEAKELNEFLSFAVSNPVLFSNGININQLFGIDSGGKEFNEHPIPVNGIGASFTNIKNSQ